MNKLFEKLLLFIINPFVGFLESFRSPQKHNSRVIIYLWFIAFGFCFVPESENVVNSGDATRYAMDFRDAQTYTTQNYLNDINDYFNNNLTTDTRDLYTLTLNFVVSRFTDNFHWLFMVFAIVFGFFYVKSMIFVIPNDNEKFLPLIIPILFLLFCFSNPIYNINGVRFWTAAWVAVYIMFQVLVNKKYIYLLLLPVTYLIHAGFIFFIIVFLIYLFSRKFHSFWNIAFIVSLFFTASSLVSEFAGFSSLLPENLQRFMTYYASEDIIAEKMQAQESLPMYARILNLLPRIILNILVALCLFNRDKLNETNRSKEVLEFLVVLMSIVNITLSIPSVGVRFIRLAIPFIVYLFVANPWISKKYSTVIYLIPIAFSYEILYWVRRMISISEWYLYLLPLPGSFIHYL